MLPRSFQFNMLAYDCSVYAWRAALQPATDGVKTEARGWISSLRPCGSTGTGPAMAHALQVKECKLFVLLTDGEPNCGVPHTWGPQTIPEHLALLESHNTQSARIDTFGIGATGRFKQFCIDVAAHSGGTYTDCR
jgi:hypothetical protein